MYVEKLLLMLVWVERSQPFHMSTPTGQTWDPENEVDLNGDHVEKFGATEHFLEVLGMGQG